MGLDTVKIRGINITKSSKKEILEHIEKYLVSGSWVSAEKGKKVKKTVTIVTPNPEQLVYAVHDPHFTELLNKADVALPDGIGLVWASRILAKFSTAPVAYSIDETIPGIEFMEDLVAVAEERRVPIALIGGKTKVAVNTFECLRQKHPGLRGVAMDAPLFTIGSSGLAMNGSIDDYFIELAQTLQKQHIGMVFVALGAPKQEYFIDKLVQSLEFIVRGKTGEKSMNNEQITTNPILLMSVGGSFDEIAGNVPRAPTWVGNIGLKWLWRLLLEPWRIVRQIALLKFIWFILVDALQKKSR